MAAVTNIDEFPGKQPRVEALLPESRRTRRCRALVGGCESSDHLQRDQVPDLISAISAATTGVHIGSDTTNRQGHVTATSQSLPERVFLLLPLHCVSDNT